MIWHIFSWATVAAIGLSVPVLLGCMAHAQRHFPFIYTQKLRVPKVASLSLSSGTDYVGLV